MSLTTAWDYVTDLFRSTGRSLVTVNKGSRPWHLPFAIALSMVAPMMTGAYFGHMEYGQASALGGVVLIHMTATPLAHRMVWLMACAFGVTACFTLGVICHFFPWATVPVLGAMAMVVMVVCRFFDVGMPGGLFFVMAAAIGVYLPIGLLDVPLYVGLVFMGALLSCAIGFAYSLIAVHLRPPVPVPERSPATFDRVLFDPLIIGLSVAAAIALAQALDLDKPYWAPVSCLAVIQGVTFQSVWEKQFHRLIGTAIGLGLAALILLLPLTPWTISVVMMMLALTIETAIVRHYGFAVIFITPMTILLAEASVLGQGVSPATVIEARMLDTLLGCAVGVGGGVLLHNARLRGALEPRLRRLMPRLTPVERL